MNKLLSAALVILSAFATSCAYQTPSHTNENSIATSAVQQTITNTNANTPDPTPTTQSNTNKSDSPVETSSWKRFLHEKDPYSLKYPIELEVTSNSGTVADETNMRLWSAQIGYRDRLGAFADIFVYTDRLADVDMATQKDLDTGMVPVVDTKKIKIAGKSANIVQYAYKDNTSVVHKRYYIQMSPNKVLVISGNLSDETKIDAIVQTLQFDN